MNLSYNYLFILNQSMHIGIYGGTFDPIHNGHLFAAEQILKKTVCDKILFIPAANPPHKKHNIISPFTTRYNWLQKAALDSQNIEVSNIENELNISYSFDLCTQLVNQYQNDQLHLIMGSDMSACFSTWKDWKKILKLVSPIILLRNTHKAPVDPKLEPQYRDLFMQNVVDIETLDISSTYIKERITNSLSLKSLIPNAIIEEVITYYKNLKD